MKIIPFYWTSKHTQADNITINAILTAKKKHVCNVLQVFFFFQREHLACNKASAKFKPMFYQFTNKWTL
jgi:hypothetical protein